jgi:hypothetical protein
MRKKKRRARGRFRDVGILSIVPMETPLRYSQGSSSSTYLVLRWCGGRIAETNFSRAAAGQRSRREAAAP